MKKFWQILVLVYFKIRAPVCRVKNVKAKWGYIKEKRSCRNMFIESSKELRFKTVALNDFFFYVFHYIHIAKLQTEIQGRQTLRGG